MHTLLTTDHQDAESARQACAGVLRGRVPRSRWCRWLVPAEVREDLCVIATWHLLLQDSLASGDLGRELMSWRAVESEAFSPEPARGLARALRPTIRDHALEQESFQSVLVGHGELAQIGSFESRSLLLRQARRQSRGSGLHLLGVLGKRSERSESLADALGCALQLIQWLGSTGACLDRGYLPLAVDDLARHGLDILTLRDRGSRTKVAALVADQIEWIRELLHKGWPLCEELSWYRGRLLAFWLRQQAAQLSALEQAGYDLFAPRRRAGWLGILACLGASVLTRSAPPFAR